MIPRDWRPHHRPDDGELIGYLKPFERDLVVPVTVFGYPLDEPCEEWAAEQVLERHGLGYLADRWRLQTEQGEVEVVVVEASPDRLVLASADFHHVVGANLGTRYTLQVPEDAHRVSRR